MFINWGERTSGEGDTVQRRDWITDRTKSKEKGSRDRWQDIHMSV